MTVEMSTLRQWKGRYYWVMRDQCDGVERSFQTDDHGEGIWEAVRAYDNSIEYRQIAGTGDFRLHSGRTLDRSNRAKVVARFAD